MDHSLGNGSRRLASLKRFPRCRLYAFERPDAKFPELATEGPRFEADKLRHPLIPAAVAVANDVCLAKNVRLLIVSGSNMSGKSTLMRVVGLNAVLAWARSSSGV